MKAAIEAAKEQPLQRLIFALGIRFVGENTAKTLARHIHHLLDLKELEQTALLQLEDVGKKVAESIYEFFHTESNIQLLQQLESLGINMKAAEESSTSNKKLAGQSFLFTGTLPTLGRSKAEAMVEALGGTVAGSVNKKLTYLVAGAEAGSKLEKARTIGSIQIIEEAQFLALLNEA
jgi:DNA ligase (NAD+)